MWWLKQEKAEKHCSRDEVVVAMKSYTHDRDYYICVPKKGVFFRAANARRYGSWRKEMFMDGRFICAVPMKKIKRVIQLYQAGLKDEAEEYAKGYRLWRETELGGKKINKYKEAARISHNLVWENGKEAHELREQIRKDILRR